MSTELTLLQPKYYEQIQERFVSACGSKETYQKEVSFAVQALSKNAYLQESTRESVLESVLNIVQVGLTLNPALKLAYLVPRSDWKTGNVICCLEPSYQGLVKLITDTGSATSVYCYPVFEGDEFDEILGTSVQIIHKPKRKSKNITYVYAVAILKDGTKQVEVMTVDQINEIRDKSESYKAFKSGKAKSAIWDTNYTEMARKTVIRRIVKYLPKTDQYEKLANAIQLDNEDYQASLTQIGYITQLLQGANMTPEKMDLIYSELDTMSASRASEVIEELKQNEINPVQGGTNYDMKDIKNQMNDQGLVNAKIDRDGK